MGGARGRRQGKLVVNGTTRAQRVQDDPARVHSTSPPDGAGTKAGGAPSASARPPLALTSGASGSHYASHLAMLVSIRVHCAGRGKQATHLSGDCWGAS